MSGVSGVSSYSSNSYQWLQKLNSLSSTQSSNTTVSNASDENSLVYMLELSNVDGDQLDTLKAKSRRKHHNGIATGPYRAIQPISDRHKRRHRKSIERKRHRSGRKLLNRRRLR